MSLLQISAPNLADVGASTAALYLLEAVGFSADGGTLLVKGTFEGTSPGQVRSGVWIYDLASQSYTVCLNKFLAGEVDISVTQMVSKGGHTLFVAQYAPADGQGDAQLAVIRDGVAQELGQQLGLDNPIAIQRFGLSADGRFLAIQTLDSTLAPIDRLDSNEASDIYLIDLQTQQTKRVSFVAGTEVNTDVHLGSVVVTGGQVRVTFSTAGQFSTQDKNDAASAPEDAYQWSSAFDAKGLTGSPSFTLLSSDSSSAAAAGGVLVSPGEPMASSAGVWFESGSDSIVAGDNNGATDIFYRTDAGLVQKLGLSGVSTFSSPVHLLSVSADGSFAAVLVDDASALSAGAPPVPQLLVWQRATQRWAIVSQASAGLADEDVLSGVLSPNGQWAAFTSMASNLGGTDPQALMGQLFVASVQSALNYAPTGAVTITGMATQGQTLAASNMLADVDGLGTISYQWLADGTAISGATGATLVLTQAQVGKAISVKASYTDGGGTAETVTSSPTAAVANLNDAPTGAVNITGTATQGQTLTASNMLADVDGLGTISYQWLADDSVITGATGSTYVLTADDVAKNISVKATYKDQQGTQESVSGVLSGTVGELLMGSPGNDQLYGHGGVAYLSGGGGDDIIATSPQSISSTLVGGAGNDSITGGSRADVAQYSANRSSYSVIASTQGISVSDLRTGLDSEGSDLLQGINILKFADCQEFVLASSQRHALTGDVTTSIIAVNQNQLFVGTRMAEKFTVSEHISPMILAGAGDTVHLSGELGDYTFAALGSQLEIFKDGYMIAVNLGGQVAIETHEGAVLASLTFANGLALVKLADQVVGAADFNVHAILG